MRDYAKRGLGRLWLQPEARIETPDATNRNTFRGRLWLQPEARIETRSNLAIAQTGRCRLWLQPEARIETTQAEVQALRDAVSPLAPTRGAD